MSETTSVPPIVFGPAGPVAPSAAEILTGVRADLNAAFGGDLNPALETPQGQLASSETAVVKDKDDQFVFLANMFDPAYSLGRYQDALARIYFIYRIGAEPTTVTVTCGGLAGTIIPAGTLIKSSSDDNLYAATNAGTIASIGTVDIDFENTITGPIACPIDSVELYQTIPGWDTVTNAGAGVLGNDEESRAAFEARRFASVAINARGILGAIEGAVLAVPDVIDAYTTENPTGSPLVITGVTLDPHSLYVAVAGGTDQAVAEAIWSKKAPGCDYTGDTTVTVHDTNPAYPDPGIPYDVTFQRLDPLVIRFVVRLANNANVPANALPLVQNAIILAFSGAGGVPRAKAGFPIYASSFYASIALLGSWAQILSIHLASDNNLGAIITAGIATTTMTVSAITGSIAVSDIITGAGVVDNTAIVQILTGTGGVGTYKVQPSQTLTPGSVIGSLRAVDTITTRIDQVPTVDPDHITLVLI